MQEVKIQGHRRLNSYGLGRVSMCCCGYERFFVLVFSLIDSLFYQHSLGLVDSILKLVNTMTVKYSNTGSH